MKKLLVWLVSWLPDALVLNRYRRAGCIFGDIESYGYMGVAPNHGYWLRQWKFWEIEVIRRGYRSISLDDFILVGGGYRKDLPAMDFRDRDEQPIYHARIRHQQLSGGHQEGLIDLVINEDGSFTGQYQLPSTTRAVDDV